MTRQELQSLINKLVQAKVTSPFYQEQEALAKEIWNLRQELNKMN